MKKFLVLTAALCLVASTAFAAAFAPTVTTLSASPNIVYQFDGSTLQIPVTVGGTPASVIFLVYTKDQGSAIGKVQNGYLGWHYVSSIDTCVYFAPPAALNKGSNTINWDGKNKDKQAVTVGTYTYYLWGYDNTTAKTKMTGAMSYGWESRDFVQYMGSDGAKLAQPILYSATYNGYAGTDKADYTRKKWVIGSETDDATLVETTKYGSYCNNSSLAVDYKDASMFYDQSFNNNGQMVLQKLQWVPNGVAILQSDWADGGQVTWDNSLTPGWCYMSGATSDNAGLLFCSNGDLSDNGTISSIVFVDSDAGTIVRNLDTSNWWINLNDKVAGGQSNGGPSDLVYKNGRLHASSHASCMDQALNPYIEDDVDATVWTNRNGDYTGDHNFEENSTKPWLCNDYNVGPYKYQATLDENLFTSFSAYDMGAVTFGLYGPDGTGLGYYGLPNEAAVFKGGQTVIDYGSPYDGYYSDNNSASDPANVGGWWFSGRDSIKGTISDKVGVASAAPAAFVVAQNSPNPFNPTTTISFTLAKAGKTTVEVYNVAGQKIDTLVNGSMSAGSHSVVWNAAKFSAGVYFYTVKSGNLSKTIKMTLLK